MRRDAAIATPAAQQDGVVSRAQLRASGLSDRQITQAHASGLLVSIHDGVFRHAAIPLTRRGRLWAAQLATKHGAAGSHRSAGALLGFEVWTKLPEITVLGTSRPSLEGVIVHRTSALDPADTTTVDGLLVTSPARTALDIGAVLPFEVVERVVQTAVLAKKLDVLDILAVLDRTGRRGRNGTAALRAIAHQAMPEAQLESMLEMKLLALVRRAGLPEPILQHEITAGRRSIRLDMAWPELKLAVEGDGHRWHATSQQVARDRARRRAIRSAGWTLDVYGWDDVVSRPTSVIAELRALLPRFAA
jgi:very-short-patch-repair endonuclease